MNKQIEAFSKAIWDSDLIASRLMLVIAELCWAGMLLWPGETFQRKVYASMKLIAPEEIWGLVFLLCAVMQIYILLNECYNTSKARCYAGFDALVWGYVVIGIMYSVKPPPAALAGDIAIMIGALWIFARPFILAERFHAKHTKQRG